MIFTTQAECFGGHGAVRALLFRPLCFAAVLAACCFGAAHAQAPRPNGQVEQFTQAFNGAVTAFNAQQWAGAVQSFEAAAKMLADDNAPQMAMLLYMAGSSHFNAAAYDKAVEVFNKYLAKFPTADRALEVRLAIAQAHMLGQKYEEAIKHYQQLENVPALRQQALSAQVRAYCELQKPDDAMGVLERHHCPGNQDGRPSLRGHHSGPDVCGEEADAAGGGSAREARNEQPWSITSSP